MKLKYVGQIENSFADDMKYLADRIHAWHSHKGIYMDVLEAMEDLGADENAVSVGGGHHVHIRAAGDGVLLTRIVRILRNRGWNTEDARPVKGADHWSPTFRKTVDGKMYMLDLYFTSTICKRVQVGTELKEVPVYETRCDDLVIADEQEDLATS